MPEYRAMPQPRDWKILQRHPLSADYEDLSGIAWENYLADFDKHGNVGNRPVVIFEGKIIDSWQLQRASVLREIKPHYVTLPEGVEAEEFVRILNDNRRHEQDEIIAARRARVLAARANGKSFRAIADTEGISVSTAHEDAEKTRKENSGVRQPRTPEEQNSNAPEGSSAAKHGKVTGVDGKTYPSEKPKILCKACETKQRKGQEIPRGCEDCKDKREEAKAKKAAERKKKLAEKEAEDAKKESERSAKQAEREAAAAIVLDSFKIAVPESLRDIFSQATSFRSIMAGIAELRSKAGELAKHPAGGWIDHQDLDRQLKQAHAHLRFAMPFTECPKCRRKADKKCMACKGTGWINETVYGSSASDDDKAWVKGGRS